MDEIKEAKERCEAGVRSGGAAEWKKIVNEAIDVRFDGKIRMWAHGLERDSQLAAVMTPDEAEELVRALQFSAGAARKQTGAPSPRPMTDDELLAAVEDLSTLDRPALKRLVRLLVDMVPPHSTGFVCCIEERKKGARR